MAFRSFDWLCETCEIRWEEGVRFSVVDGEEPPRQIECPMCGKDENVVRLPGGMPARLEIQEKTHGGILKGGKMYTRFSGNKEGKKQAQLEYDAYKARAKGDKTGEKEAKKELAARQNANKRMR